MAKFFTVHVLPYTYVLGGTRDYDIYGAVATPGHPVDTPCTNCREYEACNEPCVNTSQIHYSVTGVELARKHY